MQSCGMFCIRQIGFYTFAIGDVKEIMANEKNKAPRAKNGVRKLARCVGEYKVPAIFTSVLVALEVLFEILIPLIMAQIVNVGMDTTIDSFTFTVELGKLNWVWFTLTD